MGKAMPAGMRSVKLYGAASVLSHAPLLHKGVKPAKHAPPLVKSFVDDVKRKTKLKRLMRGSEAWMTQERPSMGGRWQKEDVNYRYASEPTKSCGQCEHFVAPHSCEIVSGLIRPVDVCDKFEPLEQRGLNRDGLVPSQLVTRDVGEVMKGVVRQQSPDFVKEWQTAQTDPAFKAALKAAIGEVSPPGWSGTVKAMKKHGDITNPWALAWWMKGKGAKPRYPAETSSEGGPGSGPQGGGGSGQRWAPRPGGGVMRDPVGRGRAGTYKPAAARARAQRMRSQPKQWVPKPGGGVTQQSESVTIYFPPFRQAVREAICQIVEGHG